MEFQALVKHKLGMLYHLDFLLSQFSTVPIILLFIVISGVYFLRIQLAVNVQIPLEYGGLGGKAIYIGMRLN